MFAIIAIAIFLSFARRTHWATLDVCDLCVAPKTDDSPRLSRVEPERHTAQSKKRTKVNSLADSYSAHSSIDLFCFGFVLRLVMCARCIVVVGAALKTTATTTTATDSLLLLRNRSGKQIANLSRVISSPSLSLSLCALQCLCRSVAELAAPSLRSYRQVFELFLMIACEQLCGRPAEASWLLLFRPLHPLGPCVCPKRLVGRKSVVCAKKLSARRDRLVVCVCSDLSGQICHSAGEFGRVCEQTGAKMEQQSCRSLANYLALDNKDYNN